MKAYILSSGTRISPFDDPPGRGYILNRRVEDTHREILRRYGLEVAAIASFEEIRDSEFYLFMDYVYFSPHCFHLFHRAVSRHRQSRVLALRSNAQIEMGSPMQDLRITPSPQEGGLPLVHYDLYYIHDQDFRPDSLPGIPAEDIPVKMRVTEVPAPFYVRVKEPNRIGISRTYCMHLKHWTHIYLANYAALTALPFEWFPRKLPWALWRALSALSLNRFRIMRRLVIKGNRCSIHPTAVVEASILGDNVSIGAHAVVRGSYLGNNVRLLEAAKVYASIIGDNSELAWNSIANMSVLYPRSCIGIPGLQAAMTGEQAFVSSWVFPMDVKFRGGYVSVRHRGGTVRTNLTTLGPCVGHRTRVGAGVIINAGREIPNDVDILPDPGAVLSRVPDSLTPGHSYVIRGGTLVDMTPGPSDLTT